MSITKQRTLQTEAQLYSSLQTEENAFQTRQTVQHPVNQGANHVGPALEMREYSSLSKDEKTAEDKRYAEMKSRNSFVTGDEVQSPIMRKILRSTVKIGNEKITQQELFDRVRNGDCSHMQNLDPVLRNRAATEYLNANPITQEPEDFVDSLLAKPDPVSEMLNPRLRIAISLVINSETVTEEVREKYRKIDALLNKEIMIATLNKKVTVGNGITVKDRDNNIRSQVFMMKALLSCHIGNFKLTDKKKDPPVSSWQGPVANAFAHCSRVIFTMPGQQGKFDQKKEDGMLESFRGFAGFESRSCATHSLHRKQRKTGGDSAREVKFPQPFNQYGMNVAIGGLGNNGIPAAGQPRQIRNDGSCGHLYMHLEKGNEEKHTGMLIGFESDAPYVMNQTGHMHDASAKGEFASSFGGQRVDEIGNKYGGREADLSDVNIRAYTDLMDLVDSVTTDLLVLDDVNAQPLLNTLSRMVSGDLMDSAARIRFFTILYQVNNAADPAAAAAEMEQRLHTQENPNVQNN